MTTAHTATPAYAVPMYVKGTTIYLPLNTGGFDIRECPNALELAAFIGRACNAHDDLVKALQAARKKLDELHYQSSGRAAADIYAVMGDCDAALAKAGAQ